MSLQWREPDVVNIRTPASASVGLVANPQTKVRRNDADAVVVMMVVMAIVPVVVAIPRVVVRPTMVVMVVVSMPVMAIVVMPVMMRMVVPAMMVTVITSTCRAGTEKCQRRRHSQ